MSYIEMRSIVIPKPAPQPKIPMVQGKNFLPAKATTNPKTTAIGPRIYGLSARKREKVVAEKTGQALTWLTTILGSQTLVVVSMLTISSASLVCPSESHFTSIVKL